MEEQKDNDKTVFNHLANQREKIIRKWKESGLLDDLSGNSINKVNLATLLDGNSSFIINKPNTEPGKPNMSELMESEASKLLKKEFSQLYDLNDYLRMLADMDKIGIRRKLVLLEGYINKVKNSINNI
jgi:hypothetical protein